MFVQTGQLMGKDVPYEFIVSKVSGALLAFSVRKVRVNYTGKCMKIRRSSDDATQDIGFLNNLLDQSAISGFIGAGSAFVDTWYDQSGLGHNFVQATKANQPQVVLNAWDGKPGVFWSGSTAAMSIADATLTTVAPANVTYVDTHITTDTSANRTLFNLQHSTATDTAGFRVWSAQGGNAWNWVTYDGSNHGLITTTHMTANMPYVFVGRADGTNSNVFINGTKDATTQSVGNLTYPVTAGIAIGNFLPTAGQPFAGYKFEQLLYGTGLTDNQVATISGNSRAFFGI